MSTAATNDANHGRPAISVVAWPYLLHGLRVATSILLALSVSYTLALENGFWSGITAAVACLPSLGTSLQKSRVRIAGTFVAAVAVVGIAALFPQDRFGFFGSIALWCGLCGFAASLLRNFGSYGAALTGFTAAVIFTGVIDNPGNTFLLAITRALEICIGVFSVSVVLILSDMGGARRRLATAFADVAAAVATHLGDRLGTAASRQATSALPLVRRIIALDSRLDEAFGEEPELRRRSHVLHSGIDGLFASLAAAEDIAKASPSGLTGRIEGVAHATTAGAWIDDPKGLREVFAARSRAAWQQTVATPEAQAVTDRAANALDGLARAANALTLIAGSPSEVVSRVRSRFFVPDILPALIDGLRALLAVLAAELFWVGTGWSGGQACVTFTAVSVTVFSPLGLRAASSARDYCIGTILAYALASAVNFAVLPGLDGFLAFTMVLSSVLIPLGALSAAPWRKALTAAFLINFMAILSPPNQPAYDPIQFLNFGMSVVAGAAFGAIAMRLLPSLAPAKRADRLVALAMRDLRRLAVRKRWLSRGDWVSLIACRLEALPNNASPKYRADLLMAMAAGGGVIDLRDLNAGPLKPNRVDEGFIGLALESIGRGNSVRARYWLGAVASDAERRAGSDTFTIDLRRRAAAVLISEALS